MVRQRVCVEQLDGEGSAPFEIEQATTDANGEVEIVLPTSPGHCNQLRVRGAHETVVVAELGDDPAIPLVVVAPAGDSVVGTVSPAGALPDLGDQVEVLLSRDPEGQVDVRAGRIAADGTFRVAPVSDGVWLARLRMRVRSMDGEQLFRSDVLATVDVEDGMAPLQLDASPVLAQRALASLSGRVLVDGAPSAHTAVHVWTLRERRGEWRRSVPFGPFETDADGLFRATGVVAGRCRVVVRARGGCPELASDEWIELLPGQQAQGDFTFRRRVLRVALHDGAGQPVPARLVRIRGPGEVDVPAAHTDAEGRVAFDGLALGSWVITTETPEFEALPRAERARAAASGVVELGTAVFDADMTELERTFVVHVR